MNTRELVIAVQEAFGPNTTLYEAYETQEMIRELTAAPSILEWINDHSRIHREDMLDTLCRYWNTDRRLSLAGSALVWDMRIRERLAALGYTLNPWAEPIGGDHA